MSDKNQNVNANVGRLNCIQSLKLIIIFLGTVSIMVGYHGHVDSMERPTRMLVSTEEMCKADPDKKCQPNLMLIEQAFLAVVALFLTLSVLNFILTTLINSNSRIYKFLDWFYHILGGLLMGGAGCLIIFSAMSIDLYKADKISNCTLSCDAYQPQPPRTLKFSFERCSCLEAEIANVEIHWDSGAAVPSDGSKRQSLLMFYRIVVKFYQKFVAGSVSFLNGIVYIIVAYVICFTVHPKKKPKKVAPARVSIYDPVYQDPLDPSHTPTYAVIPSPSAPANSSPTQSIHNKN